MLLCLASLPVIAGAEPTIGSPSDKLFGSNVSYSATMELKTGKAKPVTTKVFVDEGKICHEIDMAATLAKQLPPELAAQMKNSGMGKQTHLWLPEQNSFYQIQSSVRGYIEMPMPKAKALTASDYSIETTELGRETIEGHPCIKNKTVVADPEDRKKEFIVWNATDLNDFPVKIQTATSLGESQTTTYRNIKLAKPDPKLFALPAGYKKYSDVGAMTQAMMTKQMAGAGF